MACTSNLVFHKLNNGYFNSIITRKFYDTVFRSYDEGFHGGQRGLIKLLCVQIAGTEHRVGSIHLFGFAPSFQGHCVYQ